MRRFHFAGITSLVGLLSGCLVTPAEGPPTIGVGVGVSGQVAAPAPGGPIEAGCSFNGTELRGDPGAVFQISCPPGCATSGRGLWGSDIYTADSAICSAGIHAGAISPNGGVVTVRIEPGRPAYRGSARNGLSSGDYGSYPRSYVVLLPEGARATTVAASAAPQVIEAGCSFNATQIADQLGSVHVISCPPGCGDAGGLWGSDVYTADSAICRAGIHAGLVSRERGGSVRIVLEPGRPAYRGSVRNGVRSGDYGSYPKSFRFQ